MNTHPSKPIGFRKSAPWQTVDAKQGGVGWRAWIGPLFVARTPSIGIGVTIGWTR
jgi:hypothetical protein